jgi:hypothetical protein
LWLAYADCGFTSGFTSLDTSYVIGPLGALLAVPLSLLAKELLVDADPDSRWLEPLIAPVHRGVQDRRGREG